MAQTLVLKEMKQIRAIAGKILKHLEDNPRYPLHTLEYEPGFGKADSLECEPGFGKADVLASMEPDMKAGVYTIGSRAEITAKAVTRQTEAILRHLDNGNLGLAKQLVLRLDEQEGVRK